MPTLGQSDFPLDDADLKALEESDVLGLSKYAKALAAFVEHCETPMTVGIQGEWGSGKTSLMNMVKRYIDQRNTLLSEKQRIHCYNFDTWHYGATGEDEWLGYHLLTSITRMVAEEHVSNGILGKAAAQIQSLARVVGRAVAAGAVNAATGGMMDGSTLLGNVASRPSAQQASADFSRLKQEFARLIRIASTGTEDAMEPCGKGKSFGRVVIFVDDLDRIRPGRAVALLEILKNFMDVRYAVFVIACDREVVDLGIKERFNIEDPRKAKAFFDKIIQVPFHMPVHSYEILGMLQSFLQDRARGISVERLRNRIVPLLEVAVGTNPRAIKRFLNSVELHRCVQDAARAGTPCPKVSTAVERMRWQILIGLVALQTRWPSVASYLTRLSSENLVATLTRLRRMNTGEVDVRTEGDVGLEDLEETLRAGIDPKSQPLDSAALWQHHDATDLLEFAEKLFQMIDDDDDGVLSPDELSLLASGLHDLALSSPGMSASELGGWPAFEEALEKKGAGGKLLARLALRVWEGKSEYRRLKVVRTARYFWTYVTHDGSSLTLVSITRSGVLNCYLGQRHDEAFGLPGRPLDEIAMGLRNRIGELGMEARDLGQVGCFQIVPAGAALKGEGGERFISLMSECLRQVDHVLRVTPSMDSGLGLARTAAPARSPFAPDGIETNLDPESTGSSVVSSP